MAPRAHTTRPWGALVLFRWLAGALLLLALPVQAVLNDTGIDWCANADTNNLACPVAGFPGQDGDHGRDALARAGQLEKVGAGAAGFDFTKLDAQGRDLPATATSWTCVRDNVTGLVWEVKTSDGGLRDKDRTYTWDNSFHYARDVNAQGLCGFNDWRVPAIKELAGITHLGRTNPTIDTAYFPNTTSNWFWSASPSADGSNYAWYVTFDDGSASGNDKSGSGRVRLVRGGQWFLSFVLNGDGTVTEENTGLMWAQCSAGQSGSTCSGTASTMTWANALTYAENATLAGYDDWRLPNREELRSLVDYGTYGPSIDRSVFPNTPSSWFWSSSPTAYNSIYACGITFYVGLDDGRNKGYAFRVRLVRDAHCFGLLSFRVAGSGSGRVTSDPPGIDCGSACSATYACGTTVTLTATPAAGSVLTGWSEAHCGTATTCTVTIQGDKTLIATFAPRDTGDCHTTALSLTDPVPAGSALSRRSEQSIQVAGTVRVASHAALNLTAPRVTFAPGFRVNAGGRLQATSAAVNCPDATQAISASTAAPAPVSARAPRLLTSADALPPWLTERLTQLGIDPAALTTALLDAEERWLILATSQALHPADGNAVSDIYRLDLLNDRLELISVTAEGAAGNGESRDPAADAFGERIVFTSDASDLTPGDDNGLSDLFLRDLALGHTERLTHTEQASAHPALDAHGSALVYDQTTEAGPRQILGQALTQGAAADVVLLSDLALDASRPALSADGRYLAYLSQTGGDCTLVLRDFERQRHHRQSCPAALLEATEQARALFSPDASLLYWLLPGQRPPLMLGNPLQP